MSFFRKSKKKANLEANVEPTAEWYHGHLNHIEAANRCSNRFGEAPPSEGSYLVCRVGENYYLYVFYKTGARNFPILCCENYWRLDRYKELNPDRFESLELLIRHYQTIPIQLGKGKGIKLKTVDKTVEQCA